MHGRATPLNGDYFDNIFIHFRLWNEKDQEALDEAIKEEEQMRKAKESDFKVIF